MKVRHQWTVHQRYRAYHEHLEQLIIQDFGSSKRHNKVCNDLRRQALFPFLHSASPNALLLHNAEQARIFDARLSEDVHQASKSITIQTGDPLGCIAPNLLENKVDGIVGLHHRLQHVDSKRGMDTLYPCQQTSLVFAVIQTIKERFACISVRTETSTFRPSKLPKGDLPTIIKGQRFGFGIFVQCSFRKGFINCKRRMNQRFHLFQKSAAFSPAHVFDIGHLRHYMLVASVRS
mmetsp:Transcript_15609/g.36858  ORF Transcript_15609/g.36858 Transcript_15609/m.36858 type:complete len:234 (-) Transcript_15609:1011-1712(-)